MSELLSAVLFLLSAWALYVLLKPVNNNLALLFVLLNLGGVAMECINMLNQFAALLLLSGGDYLKVFQADQLQALAMLFLKLHGNGYIIAQIFYGHNITSCFRSIAMHNKSGGDIKVSKGSSCHE
jgi:hypothetical protein